MAAFVIYQASTKHFWANISKCPIAMPKNSKKSNKKMQEAFSFFDHFLSFIFMYIFCILKFEFKLKLES